MPLPYECAYRALAEQARDHTLERTAPESHQALKSVIYDYLPRRFSPADLQELLGALTQALMDIHIDLLASHYDWADVVEFLDSAAMSCTEVEA